MESGQIAAYVRLQQDLPIGIAYLVLVIDDQNTNRYAATL